MLVPAIFLCSLVAVAYGRPPSPRPPVTQATTNEATTNDKVGASTAYEDLKKTVFTSEKTGKWHGMSDKHVPELNLEPVKGGGWDAWMSTAHGKQDHHYIGKHWVEDGNGKVLASTEFSPTDNNPLNRHNNQTTKFRVAKGTAEPLTTYAWCNVHGTWAHTWNVIQLWHFEDDDVKVDELHNEIKEKADQPTGDGSAQALQNPAEVPQNVKVSVEALQEFKRKIFTVEAPGKWRGKSATHVPSLDLQPVEGGGWIAEVETTHGKKKLDFISKHWVEDGAGTLLGVVDFDFSDSGKNNQPNKQVSKFHVPKDAVEPLTTYALCILHGTWAHTWTVMSLEHDPAGTLREGVPTGGAGYPDEL